MLVVVVAVMGCGSPSELFDGGDGSFEADVDGGRDGGVAVHSDQLYTSGTRIKVKYVVGDDGSRQQAGLFDTQLNIACYYRTSADGLPRCLPLSELVATSQFSDSLCSRELFVRTLVAGCPQPPPSYIVESQPAACAARTRVMRVGPRITTSVFSRTAADGGCAVSALSPMLEYFEAGTLVTPSTFVRGTESTE